MGAYKSSNCKDKIVGTGFGCINNNKECTQVQWVKYEDSEGNIYDKYFTLGDSGKALEEFVFNASTMSFSADSSNDSFVFVPEKVYKSTSRGNSTGLSTKEWYNVGLGIALYDNQIVRDFVANFDTTQTPTITGLSTGLTSINTNTAGGQRDMKLTEGVIEVLTPIYLRYGTPNTGALIVELGDECGELSEVMFSNGDFQAGRVTNSILLSPGFYRIKIWNFDTDGNANNLTAQYSTDNINWVNESGVPSYFKFYQNGECDYCISLIYDKCNNVYYDRNTLEVVDLSETTNCVNTKSTVTIKDCSGVNSEVVVDSVVGTYNLNEKYKHTERVYDNVTSTFAVGITAQGLNTSTLGFTFTPVNASGWVFGSGYLVDFGNGFTDLGFTPSFNYSTESNGKYEVKIYAERVLPEGRFYYLLGNLEVVVTNGIITTINPNTINAVRAINRTVSEVFQDYCNGAIVGSPYLADGTPYTLQGQLSATYYEEKSEWLGVSDANNGGGSSSLVTTKPTQTHTLVSGVNNNIPAGLKTVTINNLSGITTINGVFQLGTGTRADIITYTATEVEKAKGVLPAITLAGGTWQWTGLQPINEV